MAGKESLFAAASGHFQRPITSESELLQAGQERLESKGSELMSVVSTVLQFLASQPVAEQHKFLCGIPEGFVMVLNNEADFTGKRKRYEVFILLLIHWPEIAEMQQAQPPKTRRDLSEWLEKQEGQQLFDDPKAFYELCGDIDLDLAPPGHPSKAQPQ